MPERTEIRTDIWTSNPDKPGHLILDRILSIKEVFQNFKKAMDTFVIADIEANCSALGYAERCSILWGVNEEDKWPSGKIKVIVDHGENEGRLVTVSVVNEAVIKGLFSVKYFDGDYAWRVGQLLDDAFHEGLFN